MTGPAVIQESALDRAQTLAKQGFHVFPSWGKARHIPGWPQRATRDPEQIKAWFSGPYKDCWPSVYTGRYGDNQSLLVVDVDPKGLPAIDALNDILPDTRVHSTPRGGMHGFYIAPAPGVKSGTHVLAEGIDIRSKGGLVHFGDGYSIRQDEAIADAPAELLAKCGDLAADTAPADRADDRIAPDQEAALQRAEELMRAAPRATDGGRNEALCQFVYRVRETCATDADSTLAIGLAFAAEQCDPPYPEDEARATIRSAIKSAQNSAGSKVALPEDFELQTVAQTADAVIEKAARVPEGKYPRAKRLSEVVIHSGNGNFVDGLCNAGELFQVIGTPGGRKSQAVGWLAYCVATGQPWFGRKTAPGAVLYIAAEREAEQAKRFTVWACAAGLDPDGLPLRVMGPGSTLSNIGFAAHIAEQAAALKAETGQDCRLIVIDTTMASLPGLDLNKTEVATLFGQNLKVITGKVPSAAICAVHHTPKSGAETGMGSQGFDACFEATLYIEATDAGGSVRQIKGNTTRDWIEPFNWIGEAVQAERNGETFLAWRPEKGAASVPRPFSRPWKPGSNTELAFVALCKLSPQRNPVAEADWREACAEFIKTRFAQQFYKIKNHLEKHGVIEPAGDGLWQRRFDD